MAEELKVVNTELDDLDMIFKLFEHSIAYQEKNNFPVWRNYDKNAVIRDVEIRNHYKVVNNGDILIVFSVCHTDKIIWREMDTGTSIYLHRIVVNPEFKGQRLFGIILDWAIRYSKQMRIRSIRMDTWASNSTIIEYYKSFGFNFVENYTTPDSPELPVHNRNLALALLEYKL